MRVFRLVLIIELCLLPTISFSQSAKNKYIYGGIKDRMTGQALSDVKALLKDSSGNVIDSMVVKDIQVLDTYPAWIFPMSNKSGKYTVSFGYVGYESQDLHIDYKPKGRKNVYDFGTVALSRKMEHKLGEATIKATKVKFFHKGDTLVYNADAFQLPEGSMLDALVRQLPGVELKEDGRIFVNGKYVESLLLNGEDFFNNKQELMLQNLPFYTVKTVKVYEKQGELSKFAGHRTGDEKFVMDVNLKKEYSIGWLANFDAGQGTKERYLTRLFAMRFTRQSRLCFYGNMNNLNEMRKPGQDGDWKPEVLQQGLNKPKTFGADYSVNDYQERFKINGNVQVEHVGSDNQYITRSERFLSSGNRFDATDYYQHSCNTNMSTYHQLQLNRKMVQFYITPSFTYNKWNNWRNTWAATFSVKPEEWEHLVDSIRRPNIGSVLNGITMNHLGYRMSENGWQTNAAVTTTTMVKFKNIDDLFQINTDASYFYQEKNLYDHNMLKYPQTSGNEDFRNRYNRMHPFSSFNYMVRGEYYYWLKPQTALVPFYKYNISNTHQDYSLFRLEKLAQWGEDSQLGMLPSEVEILQTIDRNNSFNSKNMESSHSAGLRFQSQGQVKERGYYDIDICIPVDFKYERLDYVRVDVDTIFHRNHVFLNPALEAKYEWHNSLRSVALNYEMSHNTPELVSLLENITDDADPLNIVHGNSNLRNTLVHKIDFTYANNSTRKQRTFSAKLSYHSVRNQVAYATLYNNETGMCINTPQCVNGNWNTSANANYAMPVDKNHKLTFSTDTYVGYLHSVDMTTTKLSLLGQRNIVHNVSLSEKLHLTYCFKKVSAGVKFNTTWYHATSAMTDFNTVNAGNVDYGMNATIELPWSLQFATDLTMYSRRGYSNSAANTNDLVWNARLSKTMLKGKLAMMVDGFDMLHNLSSYNYSINAQGSTETWCNSIPSYVMLHVIYRLNIQPKKKK